MHKNRHAPLRKLGIITIAMMVLAVLAPPGYSAHAAEPRITIDSHVSGTDVAAGTVRVSGTFSGAYDLMIVLDGADTSPVHVDDPDADDAGTWYYDLDTTRWDGEFQVTVRGKRTDTRYGVWSPFVELNVDNSAAHVPEIEVLSPSSGAALDRPTMVRIAVDARNPVQDVTVRVNGGPWQSAVGRRGHYRYLLEPRQLWDSMASIEVRAIDHHGNEGRSPTTYVRLGDAQPAEVVVPPQDRAMWIWEDASYNMILNDGSRAVLHAMASDSETFDSSPVTTLYFGVDTYGDLDMLEDERAAVRDFLTWAHDRGYNVFATIAGGTRPPFFGGFERYHSRAVREMEKVLNYNLASGPAERFDGVNVDIEPYIHSDFRARKPDLQQQWLDILAAMIERRDAAGSGLVFGPAIPRWLDSSDCCDAIEWNGDVKPLNEHMQDLNDYISLMNYRDTADGSAGLVAQMQREIDYAESIGKPNSVVSGVETLDIVGRSGDPETISFREEGRDVMERELRTLYAAFEDSPAFGGVAMHHYDSVRELPSAWGPDAVRPPLPPDDGAPTQVSGTPTAAAFDHQRVDIGYGRAFDDTEVQHYTIYRSTEPGFAPGSDDVAGRERGLGFTDTGLLPDTTYYYRVAAVDEHGNQGPASAETSVTTTSSSLRPLAVDDLELTVADGVATAEVRVIDHETGEGLAATVHGRFTKAGGRYISMDIAADGWSSGRSGSLPVFGQVGFVVDRVTAPGYYWAGSLDREHDVETSW